jgi:hypothetical protein
MKTITKITISLVFSIFTFSCYSQISTSDPKHINVYNDAQKIENDEYIITIEDVVSNVKYAKFKIKITNKTSDYLLYKGDECIYIADAINVKAQEKPVFIEPFSTKSKVIEFKGTEGFHLDKFVAEIKGLYRITIGETNYTAPDFQLPPSSKDFTSGPFVCTLLKTEQETQSTWARFSCKYNGQKIGFINPAKCVVKLPDGKEFSSTNLKSKAEMLLPGEDSKFLADFQIPAKTADMQFTTMNIVWKESFIESTAKPLPSQKVSFEIDPAKTAARNK